MRLKVQDTAPSGSGRLLRIAFLHQARNPAAGAPKAVRSELEKACRASRFGGREKEGSGALAERGGWGLAGLGGGGGPLGEVPRALGGAVKDARRQQPGRDLLLAFGEGISLERLSALLREIAQADYRFRRYKSADSEKEPASEPGAVVLPPPAIPAADLQ